MSNDQKEIEYRAARLRDLGYSDRHALEQARKEQQQLVLIESEHRRINELRQTNSRRTA